MKKTFLKAFTTVIAVLALSLNVFAAGSIVGSIDMPNFSLIIQSNFPFPFSLPFFLLYLSSGYSQSALLLAHNQIHIFPGISIYLY